MAYVPTVITCLVLLVIYIRIEMEGFYYLSSPLCVLLGKTNNSIVQNATTVIVSLYFLSTFVAIMIFYYKLIAIIERPDAVLSKENQMERQKI